jgi:hypothetical protein
MSAASVRVATVHTSIAGVLSAPELRFLYDLMQEAPDLIADHPIPELHAVLVALERMWGGACAKHLIVSPGLMYYLVVYAAHAHRIHEDVDRWRPGCEHEAYVILRELMESVAQAIKDGSIVTQHDDGMYIDLFRIPQWFYDEVVHEHGHIGI